MMQLNAAKSGATLTVGDPMWETIKSVTIVTLVGLIVTGVAKYFRSIGGKMDRVEFKEWEREFLQPLRERLSKIEGVGSTFITREELKSAITDMRTEMRASFADFKEDMRADIAELKALIRNRSV